MVLDGDIGKIDILFRGRRFHLNQVPFPISEPLKNIHPYSYTIMDKSCLINGWQVRVLHGLQCAMNSFLKVEMVLLYKNPFRIKLGSQSSHPVAGIEIRLLNR